MRFLASSPKFLLFLFFLASAGVTQGTQEHSHSDAIAGEEVGHVHMDTSCSPAVAADFDRALALLHNFWYARALEGF
jgi:hypothetical protein